MDRARLLRIARGVFQRPTAPYHEHFLADHIRRFCARRKRLTLREDPAGNLLIRYRRGASSAGALLAFHAHLDHPGFEITARLDARRLQAVYQGGGPRQGLTGARVRIFAARRKSPGVLARVTKVGRGRPLKAELEVTQTSAAGRRVAAGDFAMFDFPPLKIRKDLLYARNCDDQAAVAALLALLAELERRRVAGECLVFFTRAEEVGFHGAIVMAEEGRIPRRAKIIGLENSSALAGAKIGGGPVVRVGDRRSVFDARVTHFLETVCRDLQADGPPDAFRAQRKLMDSGTCETTVFCAAGYEAGALCLPLGNYHNIGPGGKPAPEYISVFDLDCLVELLIACVKRRGDYNRIVKAPARDFEKDYRKIAKRLKETR